MTLKRKRSSTNLLTACTGLLWLFLCGCGANSYLIKSVPSEASVSIDGNALGKTPLKIPFDRIARDRDVIIEISKEGMETTKVVLPAGAPPVVAGEVTVPLTSREADSAKLNRLTLMLWKAQRLSGQERYSEALQLTQGILNEEPRLAAAHLLRASILFLGKNVREAEAAWRKVIELDPANEDAARALRMIRGGGTRRQ